MLRHTQPHHEQAFRSALPTLLAALVVLTLVPGASAIAPATAALAVEVSLREPLARTEAASKPVRQRATLLRVRPNTPQRSTPAMACAASTEPASRDGDGIAVRDLARRGLIALPPPAR